MSEQHGKVIDGTARAHHWRRLSPSPTADADATTGHSEAPKSIASSLLVPAQILLDGAASAASADGQDKAVDDSGEHPGDRTSQAPVPAEGQHVNVFLAAERAADPAATPTEAALPRLVRAVIQSSTRRIPGGLRTARSDQRSSAIIPRGKSTAWAIRIVMSALGALAALAIVITVLGHSAPAERQTQHGAGVNFFGSLKPDFLTAEADPFGTKALANEPVTHVRPSHHATAKRQKRHSVATPSSTPVRTSVKQHGAMAQYSPATSESVGAASSQGIRTASNPSPPAPTHYTSPSNAGSSSKSSSGSASPSTATLRSLVTGAGTCSCQ